jgi:hypothetical protein
MTVRELIEELQGLDPEMVVVALHDESGDLDPPVIEVREEYVDSSGIVWGDGRSAPPERRGVRREVAVLY